MNINNSTSNTVVTGTSAKDSIVNSGANVTIQALGGTGKTLKLTAATIETLSKTTPLTPQSPAAQATIQF